jgi:hypothetical protein
MWITTLIQGFNSQETSLLLKAAMKLGREMWCSMLLSESINVAICQKHGSDFGIDPLWIRAIISQESGWNTYALRYEAAYRYLFDTVGRAVEARVTVNTEIVTQKMSWGLGQIMGALAREQGLLGHMGQLFEPDTNIWHIAKRLFKLKQYSAVKEDVFASYNGGLDALHKVSGKYTNQTYVDSVLMHLQNLS